MDIMYQIVNNIEQRDYIRMYPLWYKELNRNPERYQEFVNEIETIKKQSQPTRLQKFEKQLNFAQFMLKMINKYLGNSSNTFGTRIREAKYTKNV